MEFQFDKIGLVLDFLLDQHRKKLSNSCNLFLEKSKLKQTL